MKYLLGIDLGTSGTKTVLFTEAGEAIASSTSEYPMFQPYNGWAEQDPLHWWKACVETVSSVIAESAINSADIAGIGISGQMHGLVMLDDHGEPLLNSIIWCDSRTTKECEEITNIIGAQRLIEISANPALPGFTASKILWVRKNLPDVYSKCCHIMLPKDFLRYKLTGEIASEVSDASGTNLLNVKERKWSEEILRKLEISSDLMPKLYESYEITGAVTEAVARLTGLAPGTPVVGGAADNAAAAIGTGVVTTGKAFTTIGTSGVVFAHSDEVSIDPKGRVHTFCSAVPGAWTVMSCTLAAGGSLQWFRNNFCMPEMQTALGMGKDPYYLMDAQAERVPIGANRLIYLPYIMGERSPVLDANARGVFFGLSGIHTRHDMLRAVMEGVVFSLKDCLDVLQGMGIKFSEMYATGGGGKSPFWRQMMADVYNCPVATIQNEEGPALGVAILAGVGTGLYPSVQDACSRIIKTKNTQEPSSENTTQYLEYYRLYKSLYTHLKDDFQILAKL